ncbi:MAG: CarboxypepD reg-like domain, partial [Bacteroidota bacterium]
MKRIEKIQRIFFSFSLFFLGVILHLHAQRPIAGTVKDEKGKGIAYARVMVKSTTIGTVTDTLGKFTVKTKGPGPDT